jgi:hypothetical protein
VQRYFFLSLSRPFSPSPCSRVSASSPIPPSAFRVPHSAFRIWCFPLGLPARNTIRPPALGRRNVERGRRNGKSEERLMLHLVLQGLCATLLFSLALSLLSPSAFHVPTSPFRRVWCQTLFLAWLNSLPVFAFTAFRLPRSAFTLASTQETTSDPTSPVFVSPRPCFPPSAFSVPPSPFRKVSDPTLFPYPRVPASLFSRSPFPFLLPSRTIVRPCPSFRSKT